MLSPATQARIKLQLSSAGSLRSPAANILIACCAGVSEPDLRRDLRRQGRRQDRVLHAALDEHARRNGRRGARRSAARLRTKIIELESYASPSLRDPERRFSPTKHQ